MRTRRLILLMIAVAIPLLMFCLYFGALSAMAKLPTNLGVQNGKLAPCPASPNCVSTQATDAAHHIEPISFSGSTAAAKDRLKRVIASLPRTKIVTDEPNYLHVEATSFLFRFVDDVEFYLDEGQGLIHFRSASRVGYSDLGANRNRMEQVRAAWGK